MIKCNTLFKVAFMSLLVVAFSVANVFGDMDTAKQKPSKAEAIKAVKKRENCKSVEVVKIGAYNRDGKFWPIKFNMVCFNNLHVETTYNDVIYQIYKDDFGEWKATH